MRWFAFRGHALWKRPSFKNETGALRKRRVPGEKGGVCSEGRALRAGDGRFPSAVSDSLTSRRALPWTPVEYGQPSHGFPFLFFPSVQFSCPVVSDSLRPHGLQHARPPCPSPTPRVYSNSCPRVGNAIQPSHPLSSSSPSAVNLSQHQGLF